MRGKLSLLTERKVNRDENGNLWRPLLLDLRPHLFFADDMMMMIYGL
jgi:hypothetical protein